MPQRPALRTLLPALLPIVLAATFLALALLRGAPARRSFHITALTTNATARTLVRAYDRLLQRSPDVAARVTLRTVSPATHRAGDPLPRADLILVERLDDGWITANHEALGTAIETAPADRRPRLLALGPSRGDKPALTPQLLEHALTAEPAEAYWANGSPEQLEALIVWLARRYGGLTFAEPAKPEPPLSSGFVVRRAADGLSRLVPDWSSFVRLETGARDDRPRVGILEFATPARRGALPYPEAVARALEERGLQPVIAFGYPASAATALLIDEDGRARVDALVSFAHKFSDPKAAEALKRLDVPVLNAIKIYGRTVEEWRRSPQGLSATEVAWQLAVPELAGLAPPVVAGGRAAGPDGRVEARPIPERIGRIADRAKAIVALRRTPAAERRVAILYWNYPPGKQNVGASYLNVVRSIPGMIRDLRARGYDCGAPIPDEDLGRRIVQRGRNIARWAPGELHRLLDSGDVVAVPIERYEAWFRELPEGFRRAVVDHWGPPAEADIMTTEVDGAPAFVLPVIRCGRVTILPQPDRARTQDLAALYQSQDLPPHHQYVAAYLWLQREERAHAVVHTGTHGTHEWLSGKESGPAGSDPGEVLAGALPILYPYIVDDVGEGIVAKRRGAATAISHLTPALGVAGLSPELAALRDRLARRRDVAGRDPEAARTLAAEIEAEAVARGLHVDLKDKGWSDEARADQAKLPARLAVLEDHLAELAASSIPYGLHTYGVSPAGERLTGFVDLMVKPHGEDRRQEFRRALEACGPAELESLAAGLDGHYIAPGPGNDPVRNPGALPTGRNFYAFDPRRIPSPAASALGAKLAEDLIASRREAEGAAPRRIAIQLWGVETIRHEGVQESQALALLGVRLKRSERSGRVTGVELIPRAELGRPRVDVVLHATSLYRDTFPILLTLLDRAVQLAAAAPEEDNPVRANVEALAGQLVKEQGMAPAEARRRARVRVFCEPSGRHDSKVAWMASASGSWETEDQFADNWIRRMSFGYGSGFWGEPMQAEFRSALAGTEAIVHTRSTKLYGTLDNDDYFSYGGSIAIGVRRVEGGDSPPFYVTDLRTPGRERHVTLERFMGQELRSRYLNPAFVTAMRDEGYAGARHVWKATEYLWGWQVVYPEAVDASKWQELYEVWLEDRHELGLEEFFRESNPHARQGIASRMLETIRKGYWQAPKETRDRLAEIYVSEVAETGVACDHLTCDNPELQAFVAEAARSAGVEPVKVKAWQSAVEQATGRTNAEALETRIRERRTWHRPPESAARETEARAEPGEATAPPKPENRPEDAEAPSDEAETTPSEAVRGYVMEEVTELKPRPAPEPLEGLSLIVGALACVALGALRGARGGV